MSDLPHPLIARCRAPNWRVMLANEIRSPEKHSCVAGPFGSSISSKFFVEDGVPIIRGSNLSLGLERFVADDFAFISQETAAKFSAQTVVADDLVFTCWGTIGQVGLIPKNGPYPKYVISNKQLKLRVNRELIDPLFAYYYFANPDSIEYIKGRAIGSAVPGINLGILKSWPVPIPPMDEQRRIVAVLAAYDDLIEVNRRRIAVLESMARGLFEEWFVRFRFPGHENIEVTETPDGPLPEGWCWGSARDLIDFDPRTRVPEEGEKPFLSMGCLDTNTSLISPFEWRAGNSGVKFRNADTLFARITPCLENGKTGIVRDLPPETGVGFGSTEFIVMRAARAGPAFAYCLARLENFRKEAEAGMAGASGRQRAKTEKVASYRLGIPPSTSQILAQFDAVAWPMLELVGALGKTNINLAAARDLLLPRLISGELSVAAASRDLEAAA